jgi:SAM-dependent MidA family methyltransferase
MWAHSVSKAEGGDTCLARHALVFSPEGRMSFLISDSESFPRGENLKRRIAAEIEATSGWIDFSRFMELALYAPGLGYYSSGAEIFGKPGDFVTAPELTPLFGRSLAAQARQVMALSAPRILEAGAGTGSLARDLLNELDAFGELPESYAILEISEALRERQRQTLSETCPRWLDRVEWIDTLPEGFDGLALANEVLDAMPAHRVRWRGGDPVECGVGLENGEFVWRERPAAALLRERMKAAAEEYTLPEGYIAEIGLAAENWVRSWGAILGKGVLIVIDYGFPRGERFHPRRAGGTLMCHYRHRAHEDPFSFVGLQDMTAHVDFSALAKAAIDGGLDVLGYTTQAAFLLNCGIIDRLSQIPDTASPRYMKEARAAQRLLSPEGMGEVFKAVAFGKGIDKELIGFSRGDRSAAL